MRPTALPGENIVLHAEKSLGQTISLDPVDMGLLPIGVPPCLDMEGIVEGLGIERAPEGFFARHYWFLYPHDSMREGTLAADRARV